MFSTRNIIYLALAFSLCGLIGIYLVLSSQVTTSKEVAVPETKISVLSLSQSLKTGQRVSMSHLQWQQLPESQAEQLVGHIEKKDFDLNSLVNAIARHDLSNNDIIRHDDLILTGQPGYFAASLAKNMRAVAIKVDAQSALAGLIQPDDQVDVLLFHKLKRNSDQDRWFVASSSSVQTLVSNVRLMSLDDLANKPKLSEEEQKKQDSNNNQDKFGEQSTVTLEVTSRQAQQLAVAQELGRLSLVLRSPNSDQNSESNAKTTFNSILPMYQNKTEQANMILMMGDKQVVASAKQRK